MDHPAYASLNLFLTETTKEPLAFKSPALAFSRYLDLRLYCFKGLSVPKKAEK